VAPKCAGVLADPAVEEEAQEQTLPVQAVVPARQLSTQAIRNEPSPRAREPQGGSAQGACRSGSQGAHGCVPLGPSP